MNIDINDLSVSDIETLPKSVKSMLLLIVILFVLFCGYWGDIRKQRETLKAAEIEEMNLRATFELKQQQSTNFDRVKVELASGKVFLADQLQQLPDKTKISSLLEEISRHGLSKGLDFRRIALQPQTENDFYLDVPIEISVVGDYHQLGSLVNQLAELSYLLTVQDFVIHPLNADNNDKLIMNLSAKTYAK